MNTNFHLINAEQQDQEKEKMESGKGLYVKISPNEQVELLFNPSSETMYRIWKKFGNDGVSETKIKPTENVEGWKEHVRFIVYDPITEENRTLDASNWTLIKGLLFWLNPKNKNKSTFIEIMRVGEKKDTAYLTRPAGTKERYYNPKEKSSLEYFANYIGEDQ